MWDEALVACSKHKAELSRYYLVAAEEWATTSLFLEKARTADLAASLGVLHPLSMSVDSLDAAEQCSRRLKPPFLIKPNRTHEFQKAFGSKMFPIGSASELDDAMSRCVNAGISVMVQEFIPGVPSDGVVYAGFFEQGTPLVETTHEKVRDGPPTYGSPRVVVSKHIPEVKEPGRRLMQAAGFSGFACIEFKRDNRDGHFKLMEVNARHNLAGALHTRSGVDYPWIHYEYLAHGRKPESVDARPGVYWIDIYRDLAYSLRNWRSEGFTLREYLRPYLSSHVFRTFDWRDPKPFLAYPVQKLAASIRRR